ncbi:MAG: Gfo/Idh/MocA family oxidoreductase [Mucilaginibacter polytrichastri]|nr:Gfo/Idh/MocA family oxidoreductase [Mucilaginibacter polytrichastri]
MKRLIFKKKKIFLCVFILFLGEKTAFAQKISALHVAVAGLSHDHAYGLFEQYKQGKVDIIGIAENDTALISRYSKRYALSPRLFYPDLKTLLQKVKPEAVLAYNPISEHKAVVDLCAPLKIHVMVEKPLATTAADARSIAATAEKYGISVLTNYETSWYASNREVGKFFMQDTTFGPVRKMVAHDGHEGPKEIGVSKQFLSWLTDPVKNGGGAIIDFGCYGANLMTWMMKGEKPKSVSAVMHRIKPDVYPKVDDDATIVLEYTNATGIIEGSWNWPFSIKDFEVFGKTGYAQAVNNNTIRTRMHNEQKYTISNIENTEYQFRDNLIYFENVIHKKIKEDENDVSSLKNNVIVVEILDAAKRSAQSGRKEVL